MADKPVFANQNDFADKASADLKKGLAEHNLQTFMNDINSMRQQVPAGQYNAWMDAMNVSADQSFVLPNSTTIVGLDQTGKNLVVADDTSKRALVVSNQGEPLKSMTEQEAAAGVEQHMVKVGTLSKGDGKFSLLLPPGLDTTGSGDFKVKDFKDNALTNKDGTITHNVSGELNDAKSAINIHARESNSDAAFTGKYTTTADGNLLNSHIGYKYDHKETIILGGWVNTFPQIGENPTTPFRELGMSTSPTNVDTTYSPAKGAYVTQINDPQGTSDIKAYETKAVNGAMQTQAIGDARSSSAAGPSPLTRDQTGNVVSISYPGDIRTGGSTPDTSTTIKRDQNEKPVSLTESDGARWNKISDTQWRETTKSGQTSTFVGKVFVENNGDIVFVNNAQTKLIPAQQGMEKSQTLNKNGQLVFEDFGSFNDTYSYDSNGKLATDTSVQHDSDKTTTVVTSKPTSVFKPLPIELF